MNFNDIFEEYYNLYRLEAETPATTDDEYTVALRLANAAVKRWARYDNTYWKELFTTPALEQEPITVVSGTADYEVPDNFKEAGGLIRILDADGTIVRRYKLLSPEQVQFKGQFVNYAYFTGNPADGYILHINEAPDDSLDGDTIEFDYYKTPSLFSRGTDVSEMSEPDFIVNHMLANRFRGSRNPYYGSAKTDAEDILRTMQLTNNSGTWANPWSLVDNSGTEWGS